MGQKQKKLISIVGARPQFIKLAPLCRALAQKAPDTQHVIIHTGQHYDANMSDIFFRELDLPSPKYDLNVGSGSHATQTAKALERIEAILQDEQPHMVVVFGDTNATLSGALAAAKLHIPIAHIEAGLRSFNRQMPEEINRLVADHLANFLFCPDTVSVQNLAQEGIRNNVFNVGDVMVDQIYHLQQTHTLEAPLPSPYAFMTLHRQETSAALPELVGMLSVMNDLSQDLPIIFPVHPRMQPIIKAAPITFGPNFHCIAPLGYLQTIQHVKHATCVITDSGGLQKEAYILKTPCITLRTETEWVDTLTGQWNQLTGLRPSDFQQAFQRAIHFDRTAPHRPAYGDGTAAYKIVEALSLACTA